MAVTKTDDSKRLARIEKLLTELAVCQQRESAITTELLQLAAGTTTDSQRVKSLADYFELLWCGRYGASGQTKGYQWKGVRDFAQLRKLVRLLGAEEVEGRMLTFLQSEDAFYSKPGNRHAFGIFVAAINGLANANARVRRHHVCPDTPSCPAGTTQGDCERRALINEGRRERGAPLL